ncbi:MAG: hypothetical protein AB1512_31930 [Thermodesulfobacteriota bacterium]
MNQPARKGLSAEAMAVFGVDPNVISGGETVTGRIRFRYALIPMFTSPGSRPLPALITPGLEVRSISNRTDSTK